MYLSISRTATAILVVCILVLVDPEILWNALSSRKSHDAHPIASYSRSNSHPPLERIHLKPSTSPVPDTTAIILNWSRLPNVIRIVGLLCQSTLQEMIAEIVVWNNSPRRLMHEDFSEASCPNIRLKIRNSPSNLYFYARFLACAQATTPYCFIQDDDYLVLPEVINAVHSRILESTSLSGIHLLPPHEKLSSDLRTILVDTHRHTSFAWLGHGALISRTSANNFLSLMKYLNATEEELKMADNYFTILSNRFVETWFDQGIKLGGGQPFTVGKEGDERNQWHIIRATEMLESILECESPLCFTDLPALRYLEIESQAIASFSRTPCLGSTCLLEISIRLLPDTLGRSTTQLTQMLAHEAANMNLLNEEQRVYYFTYPPSNAVDEKAHTAFRSYENARSGDMISLRLFQKIGSAWRSVEFAFLVDVPTEDILIRHAIFEALVNDLWVTIAKPVCCVKTAVYFQRHYLRECGVEISPEEQDATAFRVRLSKNVERQWCIHELWLRGIRH